MPKDLKVLLNIHGQIHSHT